MERDTRVLEAGTGDSPNPWSDDYDDDIDIALHEIPTIV
jgi:hypothetical protein